tara:strand:+ start:376 stop:507 length:132 start_codon:yes stop_codon:yes gene_type:complete
METLSSLWDLVCDTSSQADKELAEWLDDLNPTKSSNKSEPIED